MGKKLLSHFFNEDRGQVLVLSAILILVILGITAFTTDIGFLQSNKRHLQNTADAAALAGARDLLDKKDAASVNASVNKYVTENGVDENEVKAINIVDNKRVTVELEGSRGLFFARVLGFSSTNVGARATAEAGPVGGMKGVMPIGMTESFFNSIGSSSGNFIIKSTSSGNWGWVNLDHANDSSDNSVLGQEQAAYIMKGYDKMIFAGQYIKPDTGANVQSQGIINQTGWDQVVLKEYIKKSIPLYIPIIDEWVNGNSGEMKVLGFACITITSMGDKTSGYELSGTVNKETSIFPGGVLTPYPTAGDFGVKTIGLVE